MLQFEPHQKLKLFFKDLNHLYRSESALYSQDFAEDGFDWIDCSDNRHSVVAFIRREKDSDRVCGDGLQFYAAATFSLSGRSAGTGFLYGVV